MIHPVKVFELGRFVSWDAAFKAAFEEVKTERDLMGEV